MKVGKPKSKRVPVRLRHKIEKASAGKQRKERKEAKKNPQWRSRLKKDPGIPSLFPYKAKLLAEIEESQRRKEEEQMQKRAIAKARREGRSVDVPQATRSQLVADEELSDEDDTVSDQEDEMDVDEGNPMAALLASAQAMAQDLDAHDEEDEEDNEDEEIDVIAAMNKEAAVKQPTKTALPKKALEDPIKAVTLLMARMQDTATGVQTLLDHYKILSLVTAGNDMTTRMLVEIARKRGRLGRGGVPNLHAAALIVLSDLHEQRLRLPAPSTAMSSNEKGEVKIVKTLAAPFRLEGLWGDSVANKALREEMAVDV